MIAKDPSPKRPSSQGAEHHEGTDDMRKSRFTDKEGTVASMEPRKPRRTDHWIDQGAGGRNGDGGCLSPPWPEPGNVLQAQGQVWRHGRVRCLEAEGAGGREWQAEAAPGRCHDRQCRAEGSLRIGAMGRHRCNDRG